MNWLARILFGPPKDPRLRIPTKLPEIGAVLDPDITAPWGVGLQGDLDVQEKILSTLAAFKITGRWLMSEAGPVLTCYPLVPDHGTKLSKVLNLAPEIAMALSLPKVLVTPMPQIGALGFQVPNPKRPLLRLAGILGRLSGEELPLLSLVFGWTQQGDLLTPDLASMPHLLIAGSTGAGKSIGIHSMLCGLLLRTFPKEVQLVLIDPKQLEFMAYAGLPHLRWPVIVDPGEAAAALQRLVVVMETRYQKMAAKGVRNIAEYNRIPQVCKMPRIVTIVDEFADLMATNKKPVEKAIQRLAQMGRAAGLHLILATQRPSVDVVTGIIKANFSARLAYRVASRVDSQVVLGHNGAEALLGQGDMLWLAPGASTLVRAHGAYVSPDDVQRVVQAWERR